MKAQKISIITSLFLLIACISVSLQAKESERNMIVRITQMNATAINVQIANIQQPTEVKIVGLDGQPWFSAFLKKENAYAKKFDLSLLPTGNYIVYVKNNTEKHIQTFMKSDEAIAFFESSDQTAPNRSYAQLTSKRSQVSGRLITRISTNGDRNIQVQLANLMNNKASVQVRFLSGIELVGDQVEGKAGYAKTFNCEGMTAGDYYVIVRTGNTIILQFFTLDKEGVQLEESQKLDNDTVSLDWAAK